MRPNGDFGRVTGPITVPMYILQMARSKSWSNSARIKHLELFIEGAHKSVDEANNLIRIMRYGD